MTLLVKTEKVFIYSFIVLSFIDQTLKFKNFFKNENCALKNPKMCHFLLMAPCSFLSQGVPMSSAFLLMNVASVVCHTSQCDQIL